MDDGVVVDPVDHGMPAVDIGPFLQMQQEQRGRVSEGQGRGQLVFGEGP